MHPVVFELRKMSHEFKRKAQTKEQPSSSEPPVRYKIGDKVLCYNSKMDNEFRVENKLLPRWDGPLMILEALKGGSYLLTNKFGDPYKSASKISHWRLTPYVEQKSWEDYGVAASSVEPDVDDDTFDWLYE